MTDLIEVPPARDFANAKLAVKELLQNKIAATNQIPQRVWLIQTRADCGNHKRFYIPVCAVRDGAGAKVMTPGIWRSFLADLYQTVFIGQKNWCQDFEGYKSSIHVEVKAGSKTRLEYIHQPVLIGQFLVGAGLNQFK